MAQALTSSRRQSDRTGYFGNGASHRAKQQFPDSRMPWCEPALEAELKEAEQRLGMLLPQSYRDFLATSNGWYGLHWSIFRLLPCTEIGWVMDVDPLLVQALEGTELPVRDEEYFVYGPDQDCNVWRLEYLRATLVVSAEGDSSRLLLNPKVVHEGDWEAWVHSDWDGILRYRTFGDLFQAQMARLRPWPLRR